MKPSISVWPIPHCGIWVPALKVDARLRLDPPLKAWKCHMCDEDLVVKTCSCGGTKKAWRADVRHLQ